jgi:hypothetical protein
MPIIAGGLVAILGAAALAGWALNIPAVTTPTTGGYPILPLMALCFVLAGIALILSVRRRQCDNRCDSAKRWLLLSPPSQDFLYEYRPGQLLGI